MATNREIYAELCRREAVGLLGTDGWMEAVSVGKGWDALLVFTDSGHRDADHVAAAMPCHLLRRHGIAMIVMPQLTMFAPLWIRPGSDTADVCHRMADELERTCHERNIRYCQLQGEWPPEFRAALVQRGYTLTERLTHRLAPTADPDTIVARFSDNKRRQYRRATGLHRGTLTVDVFYGFHRDCLAERGQQITYSCELLQAMMTPLLREGRAALWSAQDDRGEVLAAVGLVWDDTSCYYLLPVYRSGASRSGAMAWLTAEAIAHAGRLGLTFDFEGGNSEGLGRSYREFGGIPTPCHSAEKFHSPLFRIAYHILHRFKRI